VKVLYPYDTLVGDVDIRVTNAKIDGHKLPEDCLEVDRNLIAIEAAERQKWQTAKIELDVTAPQTEIRAFAKQGTQPRAIAVVHGSRTNTRQAFALKVDPANPARWTGTASIERPFWFGRLNLTATIVADVGGEEARIIGSADPWVIALDDVPRPPVRGNIDVTWDDFRSPKLLPELQQFAAEPFFLHLDPERPVLYLNEGFERLRALFDERRRRPRDAQVLHDQTRVNFASATWNAMFNVALSAAVNASDEDETPWPDSEWQKNVLEILLDRVYEERTPEDALSEVVALLKQGEGLGAVQEQLLPAISEQVGAARILRASIAKLDTLDN
jgi:hypothetical protein